MGPRGQFPEGAILSLSARDHSTAHGLSQARVHGPLKMTRFMTMISRIESLAVLPGLFTIVQSF